MPLTCISRRATLYFAEGFSTFFNVLKCTFTFIVITDFFKFSIEYIRQMKPHLSWSLTHLFSVSEPLFYKEIHPLSVSFFVNFSKFIFLLYISDNDYHSFNISSVEFCHFPFLIIVTLFLSATFPRTPRSFAADFAERSLQGIYSRSHNLSTW